MIRTFGTVVWGIRAPVVKTGDDVVEITVSSPKNFWEAENYEIRDRDIIGITESMVARSQGNYVTVDDIAEDVKSKYGDELGIVFPILSRNRFSIILRGIARRIKEIVMLLSYPDDESQFAALEFQ